MAYNVKFLKGTAAQFEALSKDLNTFYYIDDQDLYLGNVKLSNAADLATAIAGVDAQIKSNDTDIENINTSINSINETIKALDEAYKLADADLAKAIEEAKQTLMDAANKALETESTRLQALIESNDTDIENTNIIANSCNLELTYTNDLLPIYDSNIDSKKHLYELSHKGLNRRLNGKIP